MTQRTGSRSRNASETPVFRRIRASITRKKDDAQACRPATRTRPAVTERPRAAGEPANVREGMPAARRVVREDGTTTTLLDIPAVRADGSEPVGVALAFEGNEWGYNPYDPKWTSAPSGSLIASAPDGSRAVNTAPVLSPQLAGAVSPFNGPDPIAIPDNVEKWWANAHDQISDGDWPDASPASDMETTLTIAAVPPRTAYSEWTEHLLDPDAMGQRADARSTRLHARWNNLGAMNEARLLVGARVGEDDDAMKAELVKAILTRAKALEDDPAQLVVAMAEAAL